LKQVTISTLVLLGAFAASSAADEGGPVDGGDPGAAQFEAAGGQDDLFLPGLGPTGVDGPLTWFSTARLTSGDDDLDALLLAGETLHGIFGLGRFTAHMPLATGVRSAAAVPLDGIGIPGLLDAVLASTDSGLRRLVFVPFLGQFLELAPLSTPAPLSGASSLGTFDFDGKGLPELWSVSPASPDVVHVWSLGTALVPVPLGSFDAPGDARAVEAIDWNGDGRDELAVLGLDGLSVFGMAKLPLATWGFDGSNAAIETLRGQANQPGDRLAMARRLSKQNAHHLYLISPITGLGPGQRMELLLEPGGADKGVEVVGMTAGDADADGDLDLLVSQTSVHAAFVLENVGEGSPAFDMAGHAYSAVPFTTEPNQAITASHPTAGFADIDADGAADVLAPFDGLRAVVVASSQELEPPGAAFLAGGNSAPTTAIDHSEFGHDGNLWTGPYVLYLDIPASIDVASFDHVHVQVWDRPPGQGVQPIGLANQVFAFPDLTPGQTPEAWRQLAVEVDWGEQFGAQWLAQRHIYLTYRLIDADFGLFSVIYDKSAWFKAGMTLSPDLANWTDTSYADGLRSTPYYIAEGEIADYDEQESPGITGIVLGISVDLGRMPDLANVPMPPPMELVPEHRIFYWVPPGGGES
jgi:hypothetical protein